MLGSSKAAGAALVCLLAGVRFALRCGTRKREKAARHVSPAALLCLLLGLGASACKGDQGPAAQGPSPSAAAQRFTAKLPEDWPSQVPTYPRGTIVTGMSLKAGDTLVQRTTDTPAKVMDFYKAQLAGMRVINSLDNGVVQSQTWSDDARPLQVALQLGQGEAGKTTFVTLQLTHVPRAEPGAPTGAAGQAGAAAQ